MFAVLHIADFPLQAVVRFERDLVARPVALFGEPRHASGVAEASCRRAASGGGPPRSPGPSPTASSSRVIACTAAARAAGVEPGQTVTQALARCAAVVLRTAQPAAEAEACAGLLAAALGVSPHVEDTAPGVCTMNVAGLAEERREPALTAALAQLGQLGLAATAGLAATPLLALYAAREGGAGSLGPPGAENSVGGALGAPRCAASAQPTGSAVRENGREAGTDLRAVRGRLGERVRPALPRLDEALVSGRAATPFAAGGADGFPGAERSPRPTGGSRCVCLRRGEERAFLHDLPLAVAEPPAEIEGILMAWGVRTLGGLTALPKAEVTRRLGPAGLALWERAAGEVVRPLRIVAPPQTFAAEMALEHEIETLEPLLFVLRRLIDRLALALRNAGFVADEMTLGLMLADDTAYTRAFRLPEPTAREEILFRVLHTHLESLHTAATVRGLSLICQPVRPLARQQGLFEGALRDPHGFAETLGRVSAVVGAGRVGTPTLDDTHRPDAVTLAAPAAVVPPMSEKGNAHPPRGLPLRRYRPPVAATVELNGVAPAFVWTAAVRGAVRAVAGPWRGSGEWWEAARAWRREEWDVALENGGLYRLLHVPEGWFVEGEYD